MKRLLFLLFIFLISQAKSQYFPDWATHLGNIARDFEINGLSVDQKQNMYIYGNTAQYIDLDPSNNKAYIGWDGIAGQFAKPHHFLSCYDSLGNFQWVKGYTSPTSSTNTNSSIQHVLFDDSNNLYVIGTYIYDVDVDLDTSEYILNTGAELTRFIAKYDENQTLQYVSSFSNNITIKEIRFINNQLWLCGNIVDSAYLDFKDSTLHHKVIDSLSSFKQDALILCFDTDLNLVKHKILQTPYSDEIYSFDVTGSRVITSCGINGFSGTDSITLDGKTLIFNNSDNYKILLFDQNLVYDTLLHASFSAYLFEIRASDSLGYFMSGWVRPANRDEGFSIGYDWNYDTIYYWYSNNANNNFEIIEKTEIDEENNRIYLWGSMLASNFIDGRKDTSYINVFGRSNSVFTLDISDSNVLLSNTNINTIGQYSIKKEQNFYQAGEFSGWVDFDTNFREFGELNNYTNVYLNRYSNICEPITFNSYIPDTATICGFSNQVFVSTDVSGSGLRFQWYENGIDLYDANYTTGGYAYNYNGTKSPNLQTTLVSNSNNTYDTNYIYCQITSSCQSDTVSPTYVRYVISTPTIYLNQSIYQAEIGDTVVMAHTLSAPYDMSYLWYRNGIPLFDNSVYEGSDSSHLIIKNVQDYHAGLYNIEIFPTACPDANAISNEIDLDINILSLEEINNEELLIIYPNPTQQEIFLDLNDLSTSNYTIQIFNTKGQAIYMANQIRSSKIDVSSFVKGKYIVKLSSKNNTYYASFNKI